MSQQKNPYVDERIRTLNVKAQEFTQLLDKFPHDKRAPIWAKKLDEFNTSIVNLRRFGKDPAPGVAGVTIDVTSSGGV